MFLYDFRMCLCDVRMCLCDLRMSLYGFSCVCV